MYLQFRDDVEAALTSALETLDLPTDDLGVEDPPEGVDAVLASSAAFRLAGEVGAPPPKVAADLAEEIDAGDYEYLDAALAQGPYVNFLPSDAYYEGTVEQAQSAEFGRLEPSGEEVVVEHTSANPTGPVHVGRARNPIVGDAVARVLDFAGHSVDRHYYVNDAGRQMAVFTWAYETFDEDDLDAEPEREKADYDLVRYYRKGNEVLESGDPEDVEAAEAEIQAIMQGLESGDEETYERVQEVVDAVLGGMRESLNRLPAEFDEFVKETRFLRDGSVEDVVSRLKEFDEAVYEDEAWQLELDEYGIDKNLVFLRSDGTTLYATRDLAHHEWKFDEYDRAVTVLGEDHKLQADQMNATLDLLGNDTDRLQQVVHSFVNLPDGKMSTRAGTGIDLDDLLDEAIDRALEEVETRLDDRIRDDDLTDEDVERIARQVGIGAVRYDIVSKQPTKAITFEWDRALDFEAQSAPYVQYVHARTCGILDEAGIDPSEVQRASETASSAEQSSADRSSGQGPREDGETASTAVAEGFDASLLETDEERELLEVIARFPAVIEEAAADLEPHVVATYTREFAETFNAFYRECPVLADDVDDDLRDARLALVAASKHAVGNALGVLGVAAPRSM